MKKHLYKILLMASLTLAAPALSDDTPQPLHFIGKYNFNWSGMALGVVVMSMDENGDTYAIRLDVASAGIVNLFTKHTSDNVASGRIEDNNYLPQRFESYYKTKQKPRHVLLTFDNKGRVVTELNVPPENRDDRPEVPHALKDGAIDPLSLMLVVRAGVRDVKGFDAKRLYQVHATSDGKDQLYIENSWRKTEAFRVTRKPLGGLTAKETKSYNKGEPALEFYYSNDARRIPIAMSVPLMLGQVSGELVKECKTWDECDLHVDVK